MRKLFTFIFVTVIFFNSSAQLVTISATHQLPVIGDSIHYVNANTFGFDAVGTGPVTAKVWDFSALMDAGTTFDFVFVDPAAVPATLGKDSFPAANIARRESGTTGYFYYQNTANNINRLGWFATSPSINYGIYKNGTVATEFHFPITAGQNNSSTYNGSYTPWNIGEDSVRITDGTLTMNADMQGQLLLPTGTFNSVLRIHVVESFHIKTFMFGTPVMDNVVSDDYYYWFVDTILQPMVTYGVTTIDGTAQTPVLRYQPIIVTGIMNTTLSGAVNIYPNPTSGIFTILDSGKSNSPRNIIVSDTNGKIIFEKDNVLEPLSQVNLTGKIPGVYFIKVEMDGKTTEKKMVLK